MGEKLTPAEIMALIQDGTLTPSNYLDQLDPDEQKIFQQAMNGPAGKSTPFKDASRPAGPPSNEGLGAAAMSIGSGFLPWAKAPAMLKSFLPALQGALTYGALNYGMSKLGVPSDVRSAVTMGTAMGQGMRQPGAAAEGSAMSAEEEALRKDLTAKGYPPYLQDKFVAAAAKQAPAPTAPRSNVTREGPLTGNYPDVAGGVQNDFRGPVNLQDARIGTINDPAGFQRALDGEMAWIKSVKPGSNSGYPAWSAAQDAKAPNTTNVDDLLAALEQSLAEDSAVRAGKPRRRSPK